MDVRFFDESGRRPPFERAVQACRQGLIGIATLGLALLAPSPRLIGNIRNDKAPRGAFCFFGGRQTSGVAMHSAFGSAFPSSPAVLVHLNANFTFPSQLCLYGTIDMRPMLGASWEIGICQRTVRPA